MYGFHLGCTDRYDSEDKVCVVVGNGNIVVSKILEEVSGGMCCQIYVDIWDWSYM